MKKAFWTILIIISLISIFLLASIWKLILDDKNKQHQDQNIEELKSAKHITKENNNLNVYEYIHQLTHAFVTTNKKDVEIIDPTPEAVNLAIELCDEEIYGKGDIEAYSDIGYILEKFRCTIDSDIIKLHNVVCKKLGNKDCVANGLKYDLIDKVIHNTKYYPKEEQQFYSKKNYIPN